MRALDLCNAIDSDACVSNTFNPEVVLAQNSTILGNMHKQIMDHSHLDLQT
jgi:hypothetical protein